MILENIFIILAYPKGYARFTRRYRIAVCEPSALCARSNFVAVKIKSTYTGCFLFWPTRKDSNLRPSESESDALSSCATGRCRVTERFLSAYIFYHLFYALSMNFPKTIENTPRLCYNTERKMEV